MAAAEYYSDNELVRPEYFSPMEWRAFLVAPIAKFGAISPEEWGRLAYRNLPHITALNVINSSLDRFPELFVRIGSGLEEVTVIRPRMAKLYWRQPLPHEVPPLPPVEDEPVTRTLFLVKTDGELLHNLLQSPPSGLGDSFRGVTPGELMGQSFEDRYPQTYRVQGLPKKPKF